MHSNAIEELEVSMLNWQDYRFILVSSGLQVKCDWVNKHGIPLYYSCLLTKGVRCLVDFSFILWPMLNSDDNSASFAGGVTDMSSTVATVVMEMIFSATPFHMLSTAINT